MNRKRSKYNLRKLPEHDILVNGQIPEARMKEFMDTVSPCRVSVTPLSASWQGMNTEELLAAATRDVPQVGQLVFRGNYLSNIKCFSQGTGCGCSRNSATSQEESREVRRRCPPKQGQKT